MFELYSRRFGAVFASYSRSVLVLLALYSRCVCGVFELYFRCVRAGSAVSEIAAIDTASAVFAMG